MTLPPYLLFFVRLPICATIFVYRGDQLFHASYQGGSSHSSVPTNYGGYNPPSYLQQNLRPRPGQPIIQHRYNQATSGPMRPTGSHHSGQHVWSSTYGMGDGVPWGNVSTSFS